MARQTQRITLALATVLAVGGRAPAASVLFDFEDDAEVAVWHDENRQGLGSDKKLTRAEDFATSGQFSMRFFTPAWRPAEHGGRQKWPAFEGKPLITDWSAFDRLVMDITNPTDTEQRLMLFITDSKLVTRSGFHYRELLPARGHVRAVLDVRKGFAATKVNAADIQVMHFYSEDPPEDMVIHLDGMVLLQPGEPLPSYPASYLAQLGKLQAGSIEATRQFLSEAGKRMAETATGQPAVLVWLERELASLRARLAACRGGLAAADESVLSIPHTLAVLRAESEAVESRLGLRRGFETLRPQVESAAGVGEGVVVGFADSMTKVLPRAGIPPVTTSTRVTVRLARNETESLQVVVLPMADDLEGVRVRVGDLRLRDGTVFPAGSIRAVPVGYVETKAAPPYGASHVGWWPDPILDFMDAADVGKGDAQAFWVRFRCPKGQAAGEYGGKLRVCSGDTTLFAFDLAVRVYGFDLPDASPLPLAITFAPHDHPRPESKAEQATWRKSEDYPINAWKRRRARWADFLAEYYITMDSLYDYGGRLPAFEELSRLRDQGRLGMFNLGYYGKCGEGPEAVASWEAKVLGQLRPRYEKAKELGLLSHAYIYGCDEHAEKDFPHVQRAAERLKATFPDVPVMTTTYDHSYGRDSVIKSMDWWCPLTPRYDVEKAAEARSRGKQVWWYICCGPRHPHANMFVEYPAIEGRLLMGAMSARYRPDGFLYYQISIWNSRKPITKGPFTDWDPRSWTTYHGDGSWTCVGPGGTPLPTVRLENFRDGLEDYAYARILEATLAKVEEGGTGAGRGAWVAKAKAALVVPEAVVKNMREYTSEPAALYRWRDAMAEAVETAGVTPVYPWGGAR